jgi:chloramphenicol 3-O phosphotransferase
MKNSILGIFFVLAVAATGLYFFSIKTKIKSGAVIVLNGPSSSGKTLIQKEFQKLMMPNLWIKIGIDNFFDNPMPEITSENMSFWQSPNPIRWVEESKDLQGKKTVTLFLGEQGEKVMYAMNSAITAYAQNGCNVIVDYIAYKPEYIQDLERKLKNINSFWVAVKIPLQILEKREAARNTSPVGHARSHYFSVYGEKKYDLEVNSESDLVKEIVIKIKNFIENN